MLEDFITDQLRQGKTDQAMLTAVQTAIDSKRTEMAERAKRAETLNRLRYHLFVKDNQRIRVACSDLAAFCAEYRLDIKKMEQVSNGGKGGLESYKGYKRGPGANTLLNGSPYEPVPELDTDTDWPEPRKPLFKPQPKPQPLKPAITFVPKGN